MKLNLEFKKIAWLKKYAYNVNIVIPIFLGVVLLLVGLVAYQEIKRITLLQEVSSSSNGQVSRVDQQKYKQLENLLEDNARFLPEETEKTEVFSTPPEPKKQQ